MLELGQTQFTSRRASRTTARTAQLNIYSGNGGFTGQQSSTRSWTRNRNQVRFDKDVKLGPVAYSVAVILGVALLGIISLTQTVQATSLDYQLADYDETIAEYQSYKADLTAETAKLSSIVNLQKSEAAAKLHTPTSEEIIK